MSQKTYPLKKPMEDAIPFEIEETAHRAYREKRKVRDILLEEQVLPEEEIGEILDPRSMV